jgi:hypothetical protein
MNKQFALITSYGGRTCVLQHDQRDEHGEPKEYWLTMGDFHTVAAKEGSIRLWDADAGKWKKMPVSKWWLTQKKRLAYQSVIFDPSTTSRNVRGHYNLWSGFGVTPKQGSWSLLYDHIQKVLCNGDEAFFAYVHKWLAWCVQNPHLQAEVAIVFRGRKGTGKGILGECMIRIFGNRHSLHLSNPVQLAGRFTGHYECCVFVFADEAIWAGDKTAEQQLKSLITNPTYALEAKFKDARLAANRLKFLLASNSDWVIPSGDRERRWAVGDVSEARIGDHPYFDELIEEINGGGLEAMLHDLLHMKLESWHPRDDVPETDAARDQNRLSLTPEQKWLFYLLQQGKLPRPGLKHKNRCKLDDLLESAQQSVGHKKSLQHADLINFFKNWDITPHHSNKANTWQFPALAKIREKFDTLFGKQQWPEPWSWQDAIT